MKDALDPNTKKRQPHLIVLLTDFGTKDYFVGAMKGAILRVNPDARMIDLTHEIAPQNIKSAGFTLRACYRDFPPQTIFVAVVDPGVGSKRRAILVACGDYFFIAPDNGLLSFIFNEATSFRVFEMTDKKFFAPKISATFHGRDVFAPAAAHLSNGISATEFGREIFDFVCFEESRPRRFFEREIEAEIIGIDRFGNLITNLKRSDLPAGFALEIGARRVEKLQNYFAESQPGEVFMIFGSAGFLEVAVFQDSAKNLLQAEVGQKIAVKIL